MSIGRRDSSNSIDYDVEFRISNGDYIDEGVVFLKTKIESEKWESKREGKGIIAYYKEK